MNRSRLLLVVDDLTVTNGPNCQLRQLSQSLPANEFEIHIATACDIGRIDQLQIAGACLHAIDRRSTVVPRYVELRGLWRQLLPDIVHAWGYDTHLPVAFSTYRHRSSKVIYSYFCHPPRRLMIRRWLEEVTSREPAIVTVSHPCIGDELANEGFDNAVRIVPSALVEFDTTRQLARQKLMELAGITDPSTFLAGTISSMEPRFRLKDLIWAADIMCCVRQDVHLLIIGHGNGRAALQHFLGKTEAASNVHFIDPSRISAGDLAGLDAYWNAQLVEPNPAMMLTAMALGVPVVSVVGQATQDAVLPMQSALGTNLGARDEFARWTKFLIEQRQRSQQLAAQGQEHVKQKFSVQQMVDGFLQAYSSTQ